MNLTERIFEIIINTDKAMGPFKRYVTGLGGGGSSKIVTKLDKG